MALDLLSYLSPKTEAAPLLVCGRKMKYYNYRAETMGCVAHVFLVCLLSDNLEESNVQFRDAKCRCQNGSPGWQCDSLLH